MNCSKADRVAPWVAAVMALLLLRRQVTGQELFFYDDLGDLFYPCWEFIRQQVLAGHAVPLWDPYRFCGHPLLSNPTNGMLYPLNYLMLVVPTQLGLAWLSALHLWIATWGTYRYGRHLQLEPAAAAVAAVSFGFGSSLVLHLPHPCSMQPQAWFPWLLLAVETGAWPTATFILALQALCGSPQFLAFYCLLLALVVLYRTPAVAGRLLAMFAVGGLMAAVQYVPFVALLHGALLPPAGIGTIGNVSGATLLHMLLPEMGGVQAAQSYWLPTAALLLAGVGAIQQRRNRLAQALVLGCGLALACALAGNVLGPHFGLFRFPERWLLLEAWGVALLAGLGWQSVAGKAPWWHLVWLIVLLDGWGVSATYLPPDPRTLHDVTGFYQQLTGPLPPPQRALFLPRLPAELWNWGMVTGRFAASGYDPVPSRDYSEYLCWAANHRSMTPDEQYMLSVNHGVVTWPAFSPAFLSPLQVGVIISRPAADIQFQPLTPAHPRFYLTADYQVQADRDATFSAMDRNAVVQLDRAPTWLPGSAPGDDTVHLLALEPDHLSLEASPRQPELLILSEAWNAGWSAAVNGRPVPVYRADWVLRAVPVPPGQHRIELDYKPVGLDTGLWLSLLGFILWGGWGAASVKAWRSRGSPRWGADP